VLVLKDPFKFLLGIIRRIYEIQVGSLVGMNNRSAHIYGGFDPPLFSWLRLNVKDDALVVDVCIKASHHWDLHQFIRECFHVLSGMLATSPAAGKKKLDTLLSGFV
jgi:hypothetical protein